MANRPDVSRVWAIDSPSGVIDPDTRIPNKVVKGWEAEIPPYQFFNWYQQQGDLFRLAAAERGIPAWGEDVTYMKGALAFYDPNGLVYVSLKINKGANPETDTTAWARSAIQITQNDVDAILNLIETHIADKANPHSVTAEQVGAYDKQQINDLLNSEQGEIDSHVNDFSNPHKVTAAQAGGVPITGGTYTGQINTQADKFIVGKGSAGDETGVSSANGVYLYKGSRKLGINQANKPVFNDGAAEHNLLYDTNFAAKKLETEPAYYVPEPVVHLPLRGDTNLYSGTGSSSFSRASSASYVSKSGVLKYAGVDEPRFEKDGMLFEGSSTNALTHSLGDGTVNGWYYNNLTSNNVLLNQSSPDGGNNAVKVSTAGEGQGVFKSNSNLNQVSNTCSVWLRGQSGGEVVRFGFDLSSSDVTLTPYWKRYSFKTNPNSGKSFIIYSHKSSQQAFYIFGAQQETTPFPTSYIKTSGAAATRAGDYMEVDCIQDFQGTVSFNIALNGSVINREFDDVFTFGDTNRMEWTKGKLRWFSIIAGSGGLGTDISETGSVVRSALVFTQSLGITYKDGVKLSQAVSNGFGKNLLCKINQNRTICFHLSDFRVWQEALTPEQISTL